MHAILKIEKAEAQITEANINIMITYFNNLKSTNGIKGVNKEIDNKAFVVQADQNQELNLTKSSK